ncbi:MAG: DUF2163 domain-containing protein [Rickettsiales bacterium]|jgi:uncharacterized phage protein (TIGR02218 family)|nr:DUF2163 domain-containing protein [Rickettsiales bacterium]
MKIIANDLAKSLAESTPDLTKCFKITLKSGETLGFTESSEDLSVDGFTYKSCCGFEEGRQTSFSDMTSSNTSVIAILNSVGVDRREIFSGKFDGASIDIFIVNQKHLEYGKITVTSGFIDFIKISGEQIYFNVAGISSVLEKTLGSIYSPLCRAKFCDSKCSLNILNYTFYGEIEALVSEVEFHTNSEAVVTKTDDYFRYGLVKFIDGPSSGISVEIKQSRTGNIVLGTSLMDGMEVGNQFSIVAGCSKKFSSCVDKFQNAINFRGEPNLPRTTKVYKFY